MTCLVHAFEGREGGSLQILLTYDVPTGTGKTTAYTDIYHGRFVKLIPNKQVVEVNEFEAPWWVCDGRNNCDRRRCG